MSTPEASKPWWREPWPWILMAGPVAAMVACIVTMTLAMRGFDAQAIRDGGRRQGLVVSKPAAVPTALAAQHGDALGQAQGDKK